MMEEYTYMHTSLQQRNDTKITCSRQNISVSSKNRSEIRYYEKDWLSFDFYAFNMSFETYFEAPIGFKACSIMISHLKTQFLHDFPPKSGIAHSPTIFFDVWRLLGTEEEARVSFFRAIFCCCFFFCSWWCLCWCCWRLFGGRVFGAKDFWRCCCNWRDFSRLARSRILVPSVLQSSLRNMRWARLNC